MVKKQKKIILLLILFLWAFIAFGRTIFNVSKLITEERKWVFLTDEEKREKQFGEKHQFFRFVQKNADSNSNILFFTSDGMAYYLARYYLYPTTVIWGERQFVEWKNDINRNYDYVMYYPYLKTMPPEKITVNNTHYTLLNKFFYNNILRGIVYKK